jgi:hypothetical protein
MKTSLKLVMQRTSKVSSITVIPSKRVKGMVTCEAQMSEKAEM